MDRTARPVILDFLDWLLERERSHKEVMHACRRSRTRVQILREANRRRLVTIKTLNGCRVVKPTSLGLILGELRRELRRQAQHSDRRWGHTVP